MKPAYGPALLFAQKRYVKGSHIRLSMAKHRRLRIVPERKRWIIGKYGKYDKRCLVLDGILNTYMIDPGRRRHAAADRQVKKGCCLGAVSFEDIRLSAGKLSGKVVKDEGGQAHFHIAAAAK